MLLLIHIELFTPPSVLEHFQWSMSPCFFFLFFFVAPLHLEHIMSFNVCVISQHLLCPQGPPYLSFFKANLKQTQRKYLRKARAFSCLSFHHKKEKNDSDSCSQWQYSRMPRAVKQKVQLRLMGILLVLQVFTDKYICYSYLDHKCELHDVIGRKVVSVIKDTWIHTLCILTVSTSEAEIFQSRLMCLSTRLCPEHS